MWVCSMHTFIQVLTRTDRSTIVLQCSLRAPTLTPKYIPSGISFLTSSALCAESAYPIGPNRLGTQPNRSVPTDSVLGFFSRSGPCWACISTLPLKLNLRLFGILGLTAPVPPGFTPRSRSSTCSIPRASTLPVGLSAHSALGGSPAVAVLALLLQPSLPLWPRLIQRVWIKHPNRFGTLRVGCLQLVFGLFALDGVITPMYGCSQGRMNEWMNE